MIRTRARRCDLLGDLAILLGIVAACSGAHLVHQLYLDKTFVDLEVYRMGGYALLHGQSLYDMHLPGAGLAFTYTPFAAVAFIPLALFTREADILGWSALNLVVLLRVCWITARETRRRLGGDWPHALFAFALFLLGLQMEPVVETISFGQVNLIILWLVFEDVLRRKPNRLGGVALGLATGIKLVPGLFIVFLFATKRYREAVVSSAVTAGTIVLGYVIRPDQASRYWGGLAFDPGRMGGIDYVANQSINGAIFRMGPADGSKALWFAASLPVVAIGLWSARRLWHHDLALPATCAVGLCGLLVSPIAWSHHWVWLVAVLAALLDPRFAPRLVRVAALGATFMIATVNFVWSADEGLIWTSPHGGDVERAVSGWNRVVANSYVLLGLGLLVLCAVAALRLGRAEVTPASDDQAPI